MTRLTSRQKELLQEDKYTLVDIIIITESKLQHLRNEMLLNSEAAKAELETERKMRVKLEKAHITAQEELDELGADVKSMSKLSNDAFLHALQDKIDKYYQTALTEREKEIEAFEEHCKSSQEECYPCATQRHACEHDNWEEYFYRTERDWSDDSIPNDWEIEGATSEK